jgi:hypothetical protein
MHHHLLLFRATFFTKELFFVSEIPHSMLKRNIFWGICEIYCFQFSKRNRQRGKESATTIQSIFHLIHSNLTLQHNGIWRELFMPSLLVMNNSHRSILPFHSFSLFCVCILVFHIAHEHSSKIDIIISAHTCVC